MKEDKMLANFRIERKIMGKIWKKARKQGSNRSKIMRTMIRYFVGERENSECCLWMRMDERCNCKMFVVV